MTFTEMAMHLWPMWVIGLLMIIAVRDTEHKDLLRIEPKSLLKWGRFLLTVSLLRTAAFFIAKFAGVNLAPLKEHLGAVNIIPWQGIFGVYWEDACHGLPLVILARWLPHKFFKPLIWLLTAFVMISFGLGHVYQGGLAAMALMIYIPISIKLGKKHGFGTVMLGHMMYDFVTLMSIKLLLGFL